MLWDEAWHATPEMRIPFLGLPHPWILPHFGILIGLPLVALLMATLLEPARRRGPEPSGLAMATVLGRRGPLGALLVLIALGLFVLGLGIDGLFHWLHGPDEPLLAPAHLVGFVANSLFAVSLVALLYDLAVTAPPASLEARWLAWGGLVLALVWLLGTLTIVFPFEPRLWPAHLVAAWAGLDVGIGLLLAIQLLPWRFAALTVLGPYLVFRAAVYGVLLDSGYRGAARPLEPLLLAGLAVDLWLLLPWHRGRRGWPQVLGAALVFGLVWAPLGYVYFLPISELRPSLPKAFLESGAAASVAAAIALLLAQIVLRLCRGRLTGRPPAAAPGQESDPNGDPVPTPAPSTPLSTVAFD